MSYNFYKVLHVFAALLIFFSMGGAIMRSIAADTKETTKRLVGITNGVGLLLSLFAGFGLLAKLGLGFPGWAMAKLGIWLLIGGSTAIVNRKPELGQLLWFVILLLGVLAVFLAVVKPF